MGASASVGTRYQVPQTAPRLLPPLSGKVAPAEQAGGTAADAPRRTSRREATRLPTTTATHGYGLSPIPPLTPTASYGTICIDKLLRIKRGKRADREEVCYPVRRAYWPHCCGDEL